MNLFKISSVALIILAGIGAASADTIQNSQGTFIQDGNGVWHQYVRVRSNGGMTPSQRNFARYDFQLPLVALDVAKGDIN